MMPGLSLKRMKNPGTQARKVLVILSAAKDLFVSAAEETLRCAQGDGFEAVNLSSEQYSRFETRPKDPGVEGDLPRGLRCLRPRRVLRTGVSEFSALLALNSAFQQMTRTKDRGPVAR